MHYNKCEHVVQHSFEPLTHGARGKLFLLARCQSNSCDIVPQIHYSLVNNVLYSFHSLLFCFTFLLLTQTSKMRLSYTSTAHSAS